MKGSGAKSLGISFSDILIYYIARKKQIIVDKVLDTSFKVEYNKILTFRQ